jgi:pyruvate,water dikinase
VGNKAFNLRKLAGIGMRIPQTFAIKWDAYQRYVKDDEKLIDELKAELAKIIEPGKSYAVRSSANIEDSMDRSFAGQFKSVLHVQGVDNVLQAVWAVWSSAQTPAVKTYLERHNVPTNELAMAVIVQEMVKPVISGVALSRNPVTGGDDIVVEAVKGEGTQLVQSGATPLRWVNNKGYWVEKANGEETGVPLSLIEEVISGTRVIAQKLRHGVDLEWVYNGQDLYWVQVRAITTSSNRNVYSNYIPREMLPGMIKPLIFTVNIPLVNSIWIQWMSEITGDLGLKPEDLAKSFYYRVYFNMGALGDIFEGLGFPRDSVEMIMGSLPRGAVKHSFKPSFKTFTRLPWMTWFMIDKWSFGSKMRRALPKLEERVKATPYLDLDGWSESDLLAAVDRHYKLMQEVAYYNVMGPLLMGMYNNMLKAQLGKRGVDFINFDLTEGMDQIAEYDPGTHLRRLHAQFCALPPEVQEKMRSVSYSEFQKMTEAGDFPQKVARLIAEFGHLSDNGNDFSAIPWREQPETVLQLVMDFVPKKEEGRKVTFSELKASGSIKFFYKRAREFRLLREQVSGMYTHGYGLFRYYFLALGRHFVKRGLIETAEDVFYLTIEQVRGLVNGQAPSNDLRGEIAKHKADMERFKDILIPTIIYGDEIPPVREPNMDVLTGIPTSIGHHTGKVKVVKGIQDFSKVAQGDVLVIPYSDVGWTPLFARAGAVVAESGGLLSHSSIVAREYNIPAVVSVEGATLMPDETTVTVDGHKGEVLIHK